MTNPTPSESKMQEREHGWACLIYTFGDCFEHGRTNLCDRCASHLEGLLDGPKATPAGSLLAAVKEDKNDD